MAAVTPVLSWHKGFARSRHTGWGSYCARNLVGPIFEAWSVSAHTLLSLPADLPVSARMLLSLPADLPVSAHMSLSLPAGLPVSAYTLLSLPAQARLASPSGSLANLVLRRWRSYLPAPVSGKTLAHIVSCCC